MSSAIGVPVHLPTWERREHFEYFQACRTPQIALTCEVDATAYFRRRAEARAHRQDSRRHRLSVTLYHAAAMAVHAIEQFRYRIVDREVVLFETVGTGFTYVPRGRTLHANCFAPYEADLDAFAANCEAAMAEADARPTLCPPGGEGQNNLYLSVLPGLSFTAASNPWRDPWTDTVPRILFGGMREQEKRCLLPVGVEALHSFVDGAHLARFYECFSEALNSARIERGS